MALLKTMCSCGKKVTVRIGEDSRSDFRRDGKQVVYTGNENKYPGFEYNIFRCESCGEPIDKTCKLAEYAGV